MKKTALLTILLTCAVVLVLFFSIPVAAQDPPGKPGPQGFEFDQGDHPLQKGSQVTHFADGKTEIITPGSGTLILRDSDAAFVRTPGGPARASRVFNLPSGAEIESQGATTCVYLNGELILKVVDKSGMTVPDYSGWIEQANDWSVDALDYFGANWSVPGAPINLATPAVNYLFNAIEPSAGNAIMQPVLEWNAGGTRAWTLQSWYGPYNGSYYASKPVSARSGDNISGVMSNNRSTWSIVTQNTNNRRSTSLNARMVGKKNLAVFCALEGYYLTGDNDLPGNTTFNNLTFRSAGRSVDVSWTTMIDTNSPFTKLGVEASGSQIVLKTR